MNWIDTQIDHVSAKGSDLHTIADVEGSAPHDEEEPGKVDDRIAQSNHETGRQEAEKRRDRGEALNPDPSHDEQAEQVGGIGDRLAPLVERFGIVDAPVDDAQHDEAKTGKDCDRRQGRKDPAL